MILSEILRVEFVDELIADELKWQLENSDCMDDSLISAMHTVIAYYSARPWVLYERKVPRKRQKKW